MRNICTEVFIKNLKVFIKTKVFIKKIKLKKKKKSIYKKERFVKTFCSNEDMK